MRFLGNVVVPFGCGMVLCANLTILVGYNHHYAASWWQAAVSLALPIALYALDKRVET